VRAKRLNLLEVCFAGLIAIFAIESSTVNAGDLIVTVRDANGAFVTGAVVTVKLDNGAPTKPARTESAHRINQEDTAYDPFISIVPVGAPIEFANSDSWGHHVYSFSKAKRFDITVPAKTTSKPVLFDKPGVVVIGCNIHDRMLAYIFVSGEGQPAKSDKVGIARFIELPEGAYTISVWHPLLRSKRKLPTASVTIQREGPTNTDLTIKLKRPAKKKRKPYKY
jgi:plastocyanin